MTSSTQRSRPPAGSRRLRRSAAMLAAVALGVSALAMTGIQAGAAQAAGTGRCGLPAGALTPEDLPPGTSVVSCGAVGRVVRSGGSGITIPAPGTAVGLERIQANGREQGFQIQVAQDGTISYPKSSTTTSSALAAAASPGACSDGAYTTNDLKEYGTYNWWIGDGGMPGALTRSAAQAQFADAINNITGSYNNCGYTDTVGASSHYEGTTTYETDMNSSGDCTDRDEKSTWDAGNLPSGTVAQTCWWSWPEAGVKNDLREADVRYNTTDYDYTDSPTSSCSNKYDIRSVGTHESGHVFGMGHVGSGHSELTMYTNSFTCTTKARTLGKGDVAGLRSIY